MRRDAAEKIEHITIDDANVAQPSTIDGVEHRGDSRGVHIDADDQFERARLGDFDQGLAAAEANVEDHVARDAEHILERELRSVNCYAPTLDSPGVGKDSRRRQTSAARLERPLRRMRHDEWNRHGTMMVAPPNVQG